MSDLLGIKQGVIMQGLRPEMRPVLIQASSLWFLNGQKLVITSALEGEHSPGSLHYYGYALDFRTRYFDEKTKLRIANELQLELGSKYEVHLETNHIHVEYSQILKE
jgi:hypothetical protein